jgi:phosphoribosylformimino-5-aminoimidazole carboxamide ribotide isomerase
MIILPAIDIKDNNCVRLYKGDYSTAHKVADSYMDTAKRFESAGAKWIHMVDLDGAKDGTQQNYEVFVQVAKETGLKVELGGGIRSLDVVEKYLSEGISRVILGSAAVKNPQLVKDAVKAFGERIAVGIDAKNGFVATEGWLEKSSIDYLTLGLEMCKVGVKYFIFTDIDKDGTLSRPNHYKTKKLQDTLAPLGGHVIASGGIKTINNIKTLKKNNIYGAICGKSLYAGTLDLVQAIKIAGESC